MKSKGDVFSLNIAFKSLNPTCNIFTLVLVAKDVNILFDELEAVNSPCKDDDSLLHPGNLTSTSDDASRLEAGREVRVCDFFKRQFLTQASTHEAYSKGLFNVIISLNCMFLINKEQVLYSLLPPKGLVYFSTSKST